MGNSLLGWFITGCAVGCVTGLMAYLITYNEYIHHFPDKKQPRKLSLQSAFAAFIFFLGLTLSIGFILTKQQGK